jgi:hypothetical protein
MYLSGLVPVILIGLLIIFATTLFTVSWPKEAPVIHNSVSGENKYRGIVIVLSLNFLLLVGINVFYVWVYLNMNNRIVTALQLFVGVFKSLWNGKVIYAILDKFLTKDEIPTNIIMVITVFNNIFCPFLVFAFLSTSCFKYVFFEQLSVSSAAYNYQNGCEDSSGTLGPCSESGYDQPVYTYNAISYLPPFVYSYQCSSSFLNAYLPVFIAMYLTRFATILFQIFVSKRLQKEMEDSEIKNMLVNVIPPLLRPLTTVKAKYLMYSSSHSTEMPELIQTKRVGATLITNSLNMLTIGLTFPPFAVIVYLDTIIEFIFLRGCIGFFLRGLEVLQNSEEYELFKGIVSRDLKMLSGSLQEWEILIFLVLFSSMYYFLFLFDIYGSSVGPTDGAKYGCIPGLLLMLIACIVSFVIWRKFKDKNVVKENPDKEYRENSTIFEANPLHLDGNSTL